MSLARQLRDSIDMERQNTAHDDECAALASCARSLMRWSIRYAGKGLADQSGAYRRSAWWHLEKARQKRDLANAVRSRRLRVVA